MLTSVGKRIETLLSKAYLNQVMRGRVYRLYYREGMIQKKAMLRPKQDANGAYLVRLLDEQKIHSLGREYSDKFDEFNSELVEDSKSLGIEEHAIVMKEGRLKIREISIDQPDVRTIATLSLPSFEQKIQITCFQTQRLAFLATFCRFVFFFSLIGYCGQRVELFSRLDGTYPQVQKYLPQSLKKVY